MDIRYLVLIKTSKKKKKKEDRESVSCDPLTYGSLNLSTIFCRFLIDIVPSRRTYWYLGKEKKIHIVWRLVCNYSLQYLFLFVLCTLLVLIIDVYNKQTNKQKTTTKKAKTTVIWLCFVSTKLRFVTFVFSTFLLSLFFSPVFQYSAIWFWTLVRIKRIKRVERWWEVRKDCSTIWEIDRKTAVIWKKWKKDINCGRQEEPAILISRLL